MASEETAQSAAPPVASQRGRDERRPARFERNGRSAGAGTSGAWRVTSGDWRTFRRAWLLLLVSTALFMVVNSLTVLEDHPHVDSWEPWVWEGTSAVSILSLLWLPWLAYRRAPPGRNVRELRFWLTHVAGLLVFSVLHVALFVALRHAAYAVAGHDYDFGPITREFPYELRKDALSYLLFTGAFWAVDRFAGETPPAAPAAPETFDILDGSRVIRVPLERIIAITSAGNYVEFLLDDGRKPLMRAPLSTVESDLGARGFVRTHRSWLVNRTRVTGLKPEGSGDWSVELGAVEAPLSRRFKAALEALREG